VPSGRRTPLVVASAGVAAASAAAPFLTWLSVNGRAGHCGWTCYVPSSAPAHVASLAGRSGTAVTPGLSALFLVVALLALAVLLTALRPGGVPVLLGRLTTAVAFAALIWTVVVIVRYAEGGTLLRTRADGVFAANLGAGAIVALAGASGALLMGGGIALGSAWATDLDRLGGRAPATATARRSPGGVGRGAADGLGDFAEGLGGGGDRRRGAGDGRRGGGGGVRSAAEGVRGAGDGRRGAADGLRGPADGRRAGGAAGSERPR
jgi:hypothetical protein